MAIGLVFPTTEYKDQVLDYKNEFMENNESLDGTSGLAEAEDFEAWYTGIRKNLSELTVREGFVPATIFLAVDSMEKSRVIGMVDIRHRLNEHLINFGGHIGYSVRKSERRKGYATQMLHLALIECKKSEIPKVLVTCNRNNLGSLKVIQNNGGMLENEIEMDGNFIQRYWILTKQIES